VLINVVKALRVPYRANARWLVNRNTLATIAGWKDGQSRYLLQPGLQGETDRLMGYPVVVSDKVADIGANTFPVLFGDFNAAYRLFRINQPIFVRDPISTLGSVRLYFEQRYAGILVDDHAVKVLKVAAS
jgi:HK97 family phage major capsid protein